jgi:hypothetical protein
MTDKEKELVLAELAREREAGRPYVKEIVLVTYNAWLDDGHWKAPREDALEECAHLLAGASYWSSVRGINTAVPRELKKFFTRNLPQIESHLEHYQREFLAEADLIYSALRDFNHAEAAGIA